MKKKITIIFLVLFIIIVGFIFFKYNLERKNTGTIKGNILLHTGDCMPIACIPGEKCESSCVTKGFKTNIGITNKRDNSTIITEPNESGNFKIIVPIGNYAVSIYGEMGSWNDYGISKMSCDVLVLKNGETECNLTIDNALY